MERHTIPVGAFEVNCSVMSENGRAWIVDPGQDAETIVNLLERLQMQPAAILLTHAHFDHIGAIPELQAKYPELPVYVHPDDRAAFGHPMNQYPPDYPRVALPDIVRDCRENGVAQVIETPGHTPGGVCYHFPSMKLLLSGDTLFAGSIGRTDLPGGDHPTLIASLRKLAELPDETLVVPGHGPTTTIATEKRSNPWM